MYRSNVKGKKKVEQQKRKDGDFYAPSGVDKRERSGGQAPNSRTHF